MAAISAVYTCGKDPGNNDPINHPLPSASTAKDTPKSVEKGRNSLMPEVNIMDSSYEFGPPPGIEMNMEEYKNATVALAKEVNRLIKNHENNFHVDGGFGRAIVQKFIQEVFQIAQKTPQFRSYLTPFTGKHPLEIVKALQPILLSAGYYFVVGESFSGTDKNGKPEIQPSILFASLSNVRSAEVQDQQGKYIIPIADATPVLSVPEMFISGRFEPSIGLPMYFPLSAKKVLDRHFTEMPEMGFLPADADFRQLTAEYERDTKNHEATHAFLSKRFPVIGKEDSIDHPFSVPLQVQIAPQRLANLSGYYNPVSFSELCAVGNELYNSKSPMPISYYSYIVLGRGENTITDHYSLVKKLLPLYTLIYGPESQQKRNILHRLANNMPTDTLDLVRLVHDTFKPQDIKKVGEKLYEQGYDLMHKAERGELRRVEIRF